jgi:hypothetical protein
VSRAPHIAYVTSLNGWGDGAPSDEDRETFCALVEARLATAYPGRTVEAYVDEEALDSRVVTDDDTLDPEEICAWVGTDVWSEWCAGERAPETEVTP